MTCRRVVSKARQDIRCNCLIWDGSCVITLALYCGDDRQSSGQAGIWQRGQREDHDADLGGHEVKQGLNIG